MLTSKDYRKGNWEHVTWQILAGIYAKGYVKSSILPPEEYLHWMIERYDLHAPESIKISFESGPRGRKAWRIIIRQAREQRLKPQTA